VGLDRAHGRSSFPKGSERSTLGSRDSRRSSGDSTPGSGSVRRYYDPATGQFISLDPAVDLTEAPYAYVNGDPVDGTDQLGLGCLWNVCTHSFDPMASLDAIVNFGRGASFGLSDRIANWIVPGASCTVAQDSVDQFIGSAATTLVGGEALGALLRSGRFGEFLARLSSIDFADETGSLGEDPSVRDVLEGKRGSIRNAPLPPGSPAWEDVADMTMSEIRAAARANEPGYKTILKLLTDNRFNKPG
jgi:hypothetical protein